MSCWSSEAGLHQLKIRITQLDSSHSIVMPLGSVVVETNLLRPLEKCVPIMRYHAVRVGDADRKHWRGVSCVFRHGTSLKPAVLVVWVLFASRVYGIDR